MAVVRAVSALVGAGAELGKGVDDVVVERFEEEATIDGGGLEGVFVEEGVGVEAAGGTSENIRFCLISPYSFHSSTSSRSYIFKYSQYPNLRCQ